MSEPAQICLNNVILSTVSLSKMAYSVVSVEGEIQISKKSFITSTAVDRSIRNSDLTMQCGFMRRHFFNMSQTPASFCLFLFFSQHNDKYSTKFAYTWESRYGVLGIRTRDSRMDGVDESTMAIPDQCHQTFYPSLF